MIRIALGIEDETTKRAAHSISAHPGIDEAVLLAPVTSNTFDTVPDATGCSVVVGDGAVAEANRLSLPAVTSGSDLTSPGYHTASLYGLALSLAVGVVGTDIIAVAEPGATESGQAVMFPSPIDLVDAGTIDVDGHSILRGGSDELAAALVVGSGVQRVIMDHPEFLAGIALAAGAALAVDAPPAEPLPVWTQARQYLRIATAMGLVLGER